MCMECVAAVTASIGIIGRMLCYFGWHKTRIFGYAGRARYYICQRFPCAWSKWVYKSYDDFWKD